MIEKKLSEIYAGHIGKISDKWSVYLSEYDRVLREYRNGPVKLLEIGVLNGGSLEIWPKYFQDGEVFVGCDISSKCAKLQYDDPKVHLVIGDASSKKTQDKITAISPEFNIVIDDASHKSSHIVDSFISFFPRITDGGIYIAEDLHCSYWDQYEGGLFQPLSAISFFKRLVDIVNMEHWGIENTPMEHLEGFVSGNDNRINDALLKQIHSVEFVNSMCIVRKLPGDLNRLGTRIIAGQKEEAFPGHHSQPWAVPSQAKNQWARMSVSAEAELALRNRELRAMRKSASWRITAPFRWLRKKLGA